MAVASGGCDGVSEPVCLCVARLMATLLLSECGAERGAEAEAPCKEG